MKNANYVQSLLLYASRRIGLGQDLISDLRK